jgi:hypothetical protein
MDLFLDPRTGKPLAGQLYEQLRQAISEGRLQAGDRLTPSRQLAAELQVSRHTVTTAYSRLVAEGFAEGQAGGGSVVAPTSAAPMSAGRLVLRPPNALGPSRRFASWAPIFAVPDPPYRFDLCPGQPDPSLFPATLWRRRVAAAAATVSPDYGDPVGEPRLRQAIADWIVRSRSVRASEDTIVVTSGAQHAWVLAGRPAVHCAERAGDHRAGRQRGTDRGRTATLGPDRLCDALAPVSPGHADVDAAPPGTPPLGRADWHALWTVMSRWPAVEVQVGAAGPCQVDKAPPTLADGPAASLASGIE